jgi:hypothetical protein
VHRERAEREGDRIELRIGQHAGLLERESLRSGDASVEALARQGARSEGIEADDHVLAGVSALYIPMPLHLLKPSCVALS